MSHLQEAAISYEVKQRLIRRQEMKGSKGIVEQCVSNSVI